ncbi:unnamed protein product [Macrosiphum euphorbiae]|uniref:THAP-type domain-containing protein n=1 Tax=Macrosiphum euphorbiae TaxID=13131 RepID=A0AAV0WQ96_9HEMI|nr:unnamed protein product [Macrosiphum euphorbiae]
MVQTCSVAFCKSRKTSSGDLHFFSFPLKNPDLLQHWVSATKKDLFFPNRWSKICSNHFLPIIIDNLLGNLYFKIE